MLKLLNEWGQVSLELNISELRSNKSEVMWGWGQREHSMECNMNTYEKNFWQGKISLELNIPELRSNEAEVTWGWGQKEHFVECNLSTFMFLWPHFENFGRGQIKLRSKREFMENNTCIRSEENRRMVFNLKLMAVEAWTCFSLLPYVSCFSLPGILRQFFENG